MLAIRKVRSEGAAESTKRDSVFVKTLLCFRATSDGNPQTLGSDQLLFLAQNANQFLRRLLRLSFDLP
ncbi:MAG TPA: hypothetical protein VNT79_03480, partial [Phycisphaerae bacterium]|nr:hypothetical protein [Phycisphaerae bacterium]